MKNWLIGSGRLWKIFPKWKKKRCFRGVSFLVNGKMCVSVSGENLMCRIDPEIYESALQKKGAMAVIMKGKQMKGWSMLAKRELPPGKTFVIG